MSTLPVFVGLDYHHSTVQVCVMDAAGRVLLNKACENRWQAIVQLACAAGTPRRVAIEACTGSLDLAQELVDHAAWSVDLAHSTYVARMKRQPDKTDYSDARMLADLTRVGYLPRVWLPPLYIRDLRRLVSLRGGIVDQHRNIKLRLGALLRDCRITPPGSSWTKPWLAWIKRPDSLPPAPRLIAEELLANLEDSDARLRRAEKLLATFTADDHHIAYLDTLASVGPVTAWILRAYVGDITRFKNGKQLAHYCGLSPANASSGKRVADAGLVDSGNKLLRSTLIELAHRLARTSPRWKTFRQKMLARSKPKALIAAAIANRHVRALYYPWKQFQLTGKTITTPTTPATPATPATPPATPTPTTLESPAGANSSAPASTPKPGEVLSSR